MNNDQPNVAVYWDFENIHASLLNQKIGPDAYRLSRFMPQEPLVDVEALMEFAASLGAVAINRAYCNWQWFSRYREVLLHNAVELIQLFPPGGSAKNGADIKLCLDATEDIIRFPHISTIVIVGGDSDFLPVAQKIKAMGKTLVGIGCERSTNRHWAHSCHEFRYYEKLIIDQPPVATPATETLPAPTVMDEAPIAAAPETVAEIPPPPPPVPPEAAEVAPPASLAPAELARPAALDSAELVPPMAPDAVDLIRRAIMRLSANKGDPWVLKAAIRPMVKRLDSTFDEKSYGATTFAGLLKLHADVFEVRKGQSDHEYRIRGRAKG
jgi:uncharacterized protein (TIGR00288 family)